MVSSPLRKVLSSLLVASCFILTIPLAGCSASADPSTDDEVAQTDEASAIIVAPVATSTATEKQSCACVPNNCCCGPVGKPCKWVGRVPRPSN